MNFTEAMHKLIDGEKVRIIGWNTSRYLIIDSSNVIWEVNEGTHTTKHFELFHYMINVSCWEIYYDDTWEKWESDFRSDMRIN